MIKQKILSCFFFSAHGLTQRVIDKGDLYQNIFWQMLSL